MIRRPPRSTRTDTLFPYTTLFRSPQSLEDEISLFQCKAVQPDEESGRRAAAVLSCIVVSKRSYQEGLIGVILQQPDRGFPRLTPELKVGLALWPSTISLDARRVGEECVSPCWSRWSPLPSKSNRIK